MLIWPITTLIVIGLSLMLLERVIPARPLERVSGWWIRVIIINILQVGVVVLGGLTWESWLSKVSVFDLSNLQAPVAGLLGYFVVTFAFYWWHRWRHDINFLWLLCHQIHHSPTRIETITSFYKHPLEIAMNSVIISLIVYTGLGVSPEAGAWLTVYMGIGEFLYHMNIRTPYWWGFIFQRPESHRIHHQLGRHYNNFADIPLWDMMFGTFKNPKSEVECGFKGDRELRFIDMLSFKNVNDSYKK